MLTRCSATGCRRRRTSRSRSGTCWRPSWAPTGSPACASGRTRRCSWTTMAGEMSRTVEITRVYHFSAAHQLANPALPAADNAALYGACHRPHGHNYYLEVTVAGAPDARTGMAVDLAALDGHVQQRVLDQVDHAKLEEVTTLAGVVTTRESPARPVRGPPGPGRATGG